MEETKKQLPVRELLFVLKTVGFWPGKVKG
jgi:hypothetical protein